MRSDQHQNAIVANVRAELKDVESVRKQLITPLCARLQPLLGEGTLYHVPFDHGVPPGVLSLDCNKPDVYGPVFHRSRSNPSPRFGYVSSDVCVVCGDTMENGYLAHIQTEAHMQVLADSNNAEEPWECYVQRVYVIVPLSPSTAPAPDRGIGFEKDLGVLYGVSSDSAFRNGVGVARALPSQDTRAKFVIN